ncbi:MAG: extracellular solute-binding protein [Verrucomicrobiota bacterium]
MNPARLPQLRNLLAILVLSTGFIWSAWHVFNQRRADAPQGKIVLRIGHWLMNPGMREAFDEAIKDYEALHPEVRIEQILVPTRSYATWTRTQLIGETAPDITGMLFLKEELITRHFISLADEVTKPNPYNTGTSLEGIPWRDTFVDGLDGSLGYTPTSGEHFGVNLQVNCLRLFYNRPLMLAITGRDTPPATYAELRALGPLVDAYNRRKGRAIVPIASSGTYGGFLSDVLFSSQTQRHTLEHSPAGNLRFQQAEIAQTLLAGGLDLDGPEIRKGFSLVHDVSKLMQAGFDQLAAGDALFTYLQGNALMIYTGNWDNAVLKQEAGFPNGVTHLPMPGRDDPDYGPNSLGLTSEATGGTEALMGVVRNSRHPEVAIDFLHYLTSLRGAERFTKTSQRVSSTVDTPQPPELKQLTPLLEGALPGFSLSLPGFGGRNSTQAYMRNRHLLLGPNGDVDAFIARLKEDYLPALREDFTHYVSRTRKETRSLDSLIGLHFSQHEDGSPGTGWSRLVESQHRRQIESLTYQDLTAR